MIHTALVNHHRYDSSFIDYFFNLFLFLQLSVVMEGQRSLDVQPSFPDKIAVFHVD